MSVHHCCTLIFFQGSNQKNYKQVSLSKMSVLAWFVEAIPHLFQMQQSVVMDSKVDECG